MRIVKALFKQRWQPMNKITPVLILIVQVSNARRVDLLPCGQRRLLESTIKHQAGIELAQPGSGSPRGLTGICQNGRPALVALRGVGHVFPVFFSSGVMNPIGRFFSVGGGVVFLWGLFQYLQ